MLGVLCDTGAEFFDGDETGRKLPILCAGDIFDRWNSPPELINFALQYLPPLIAIPGQHDLPWHGLEEIRRSAYWTLVENGRVWNLEPGMWLEFGPLALYSFPWGIPLQPPLPAPGLVPVLIGHQYVWSDGCGGFPGAPEAGKLENLMPILGQYRAAIFGDNHQGFLQRLRGKLQGQEAPADCIIFNCGGFLRRRSDERNRNAAVGVLQVSLPFSEASRCRVIVVGLPNDREKWVDRPVAEPVVASREAMDAFLGDLGGLCVGRSGMEFVELLRRRANDPVALSQLDGSSEELAQAVRELLLEVLDGAGSQSGGVAAVS